jgi:hypothetical protein
MAHDPSPRLLDGARDVVYAGVGFGVLGFQRLQVRRRELQAVLGDSLPMRPSDVNRLVGRLPLPR